MLCATGNRHASRVGAATEQLADPLPWAKRDTLLITAEVNMCDRYLGYMVGALLLTSGAASAAAADGKAEYELRSAQRYVAIFLSLDRNKDGVVSRPEARGDLNFSP